MKSYECLNYSQQLHLYRIYEYSDAIFFPEEFFSCGTLQNYVETGILTKEEVIELWKPKGQKK